MIPERTNKEISEKLMLAKIHNRTSLESFKRHIAKTYGIAIPRNSDLLKIYHETLAKKRAKGFALPILETLLRKRPIRSLSGVVNVSVLTKPYACPGKCIFCPSQKDVPKSYLAGEPAVQRAIFHKFNPYKQAQGRLQALKETGHPIDKIELRIIGGTWSYYPKHYQYWFVKECFRACNNFYKNPKSKILNPKQIQKSEIQILKTEQKKNEKAKCRIIGISMETRPDYINLPEIKRLRTLGATKIELGVQSIYDDVLLANNRGHNVASTINATKLLRDAGFKIAYQVMPGLLGSNLRRDQKMFKELFSNQNFQPDYLKIYPLALIKDTPLYIIYQQKKYTPYTEKELIELLVAIKQFVPYWCRIERVIRDIPSCDIIEGGAKILNLRETVWQEIKKRGLRCKCVRCREVGENYDPKEKLFLFREKYPAAGGQEIFLSFENKTRAKLYAILRLRFPDFKAPSALQSLVRELHVYGQMAQISGSRTTASSVQHAGLGKKLMAEAEKIAKENGFNKIAVISGIGVRGYYRAKLGYKLQGTYMIKNLK